MRKALFWGGVAGLLLVFGPLLLVQGKWLWESPQYQFFPLFLAALAWLAWQRSRQLGPLRPGRSWLFLLAALPVLALQALAGLGFSGWSSQLAATLLLPVLAYGLGGRLLFVRQLPVWLCLLAILPLPLGSDQQLVTAMQFETSHWGGFVLDALGVLHLRHGNIIELPEANFFVEEACSGINSLRTIFACALLYLLWKRPRALRGLWLLLSSLACVLFFNLVRVVGITLITTRLEIPIGSGWRHEVFGLVLFAGALAMILSSERLFCALTPQSFSEPRPPLEALGSTVWPTLPSSPLSGPVWLLALVGVLGLSLYASLPQQSLASARLPQPRLESFPELGEEALPESYEGWQRRGYSTHERGEETIFGQFSQTWHYEAGVRQAAVSLDYPFVDWHELSICYRAVGWTQGTRSIERGVGPSGLDLVSVAWSRPGQDEFGQLIFLLFNGSLEPVPEPANWLHRLFERFRLEDAVSPIDDQGPLFQLQVFVEGFEPLADEEIRRARGLLLESFERLRTAWPELEEVQP